MADHNALRGKYYIAKVDDVFHGKDSRVRKVTIAYKNFRQGEKLNVYKGVNDTKTHVVCRD